MYLRELGFVAERREDSTELERFAEIQFARDTIFKSNPDAVSAEVFHFNNVYHEVSWANRASRAARLR